MNTTMIKAANKLSRSELQELRTKAVALQSALGAALRKTDRTEAKYAKAGCDRLIKAIDLALQTQ